MKILLLTNRLPYPLNDGGNLAVHFYIQGYLDAGVELSLLSMNTVRHPVSETSLPSCYAQLKHFVTVRIDNRVKPIPAFLNLFTNKSYNITRFISNAYRSALVQLLEIEQFDVIQLEGLYLSPYVPVIRAHSQALIAIRQHNVEFTIWEQLAAHETRRLRKWYLKLLARRLRRYETEQLNGYDALVPISSADARHLLQLGARKPLFIQSFGIDPAAIPFTPSVTTPPTLYHLGAMDWMPNQDALTYFLENIMPLVTKQAPDIRFFVAGRNMPASFNAYQNEQVTIVGEVPDALAFEKDKSILVVPLRAGGGVRIKVLQAMAMGKVVISTRVGVAGIDAKNGQDLMIADSPEAFAATIIALAESPETMAAMGKAARHVIETKHNRSKMIAALLAFYRRLLEAKKQTRNDGK